MSKLHLVFGGRVKDPRGLDFDLDTIDLVGLYGNYSDAEEAWRGRAQRSVDDAEMKYVVVHLHRLLEPDSEGINRPTAETSARRYRQISKGRWSSNPDRKPPTCAGVATSTPWNPASMPVMIWRTTQAASSHAALIIRLSERDFTMCFCWPKLSAKAPMIPLIAPLAPTIGIVPWGVTSHSAIAATYAETP